MIRLVNKQGMETYPPNDYPFIEVESVFDGLRYVTQDSYTYRRERHDPEYNWHEWFREVAWSHTVTTEPEVVSRGYVLPAGQGWIPIDRFNITDHKSGETYLQFLYADGSVAALHEWNEEVDIQRKVAQWFADRTIAYRIAQPLERKP